MSNCLTCKYFQSYYEEYDEDDLEPLNFGRCLNPKNNGKDYSAGETFICEYFEEGEVVEMKRSFIFEEKDIEMLLAVKKRLGKESIASNMSCGLSHREAKLCEKFYSMIDINTGGWSK